ncbi:hypothetical protein Tco_0521569, partial [Tanacetum coccineum]
RAIISAINLDDYQLDPVTPPPSPSSPFVMAAYQRMIAETDPTQREEALTETGQNSVPVPETTLTVCTTRLRGQLHTILEDMDCNTPKMGRSGIRIRGVLLQDQQHKI